MRRTSYREVTSPANALLKVFRSSLTEGTTRQGWLAVEGPFLVEEALERGAARPDTQRDRRQQRRRKVHPAA